MKQLNLHANNRTAKEHAMNKLPNATFTLVSLMATHLL